MRKESALHELMNSRMNSVMDDITNNDRKYQEIIRKSNNYYNRIGSLNLSKKIWILIDRYISEQNALGSRYGMLAYLLGFSDCREILLERCSFAETREMVSEE